MLWSEPVDGGSNVESRELVGDKPGSRTLGARPRRNVELSRRKDRHYGNS